MNNLATSQQEQNQIKEIDWEKLSYEIDFISTKLLELFYRPISTAFTLQEIISQMKKLQAKNSTIRNRIYEFDKIGLLKILPNTRPLCIHSIPAYENNVKKLILIAYARFGVQSTNIQQE